MVDQKESPTSTYADPSKVPIRVLLGSLTVPHLWALGSGFVLVISAIAATAYALGQKSSDSDHKAQVQELERQLSQANSLNESSERKHQKEVAELQELMRRIQGQNIDRQRQGLTLGPAPTRFPDYRGFPNLIGFWRGTAPEGYSYSIELKPQDSDEIIARFNADSTNCQLSLKLFRATDDQLVTSNYFFRPVAATPNCPELESLMIRPLEVQGDVRWTFANGRVFNSRLYKRV